MLSRFEPREKIEIATNRIGTMFLEFGKQRQRGRQKERKKERKKEIKKERNKERKKKKCRVTILSQMDAQSVQKTQIFWTI